MKKVSLVLITTLLCLFSYCQSTTEWMPIGSGKDGSLIYLNTKVVDKYGSIVKVWTKKITPKEMIKGVEYKNVMAMNLEEYDCSKRMMRLYSITWFNPDGSRINSIHVKDGEEPVWDNSMPDTIGEIKLDAVCKYFNN